MSNHNIHTPPEHLGQSNDADLKQSAIPSVGAGAITTMALDDPVVRILREAAARGRELRVMRARAEVQSLPNQTDDESNTAGTVSEVAKPADETLDPQPSVTRQQVA
jgi:hypothetical protein